MVGTVKPLHQSGSKRARYLLATAQNTTPQGATGRKRTGATPAPLSRPLSNGKQQRNPFATSNTKRPRTEATLDTQLVDGNGAYPQPASKRRHVSATCHVDVFKNQPQTQEFEDNDHRTTTQHRDVDGLLSLSTKCHGDRPGYADWGGRAMFQRRPKPPHYFDREFLRSGRLNPRPRSALAGAGMINLGNTCYLNAVLQALFSLDAFRIAIKSAASAHQESLPQDGVLIALARCLASRTVGSMSPVRPDQVKNAVGRRLGTFSNFFQQDAHEFFCALLEGVQAETLSVEAKSLHKRQHIRVSETLDPSTRALGMAVRHELECCRCGHRTSLVEQCNHLSLDLPESAAAPASDLGAHSVVVPQGIDALVQAYFAEEHVTKDCARCGGVDQKHVARRKILRLPRVLALHVKRFQVIPATGDPSRVACVKNHDPVGIPTIVRLRPFCTTDVARPLHLPEKGGVLQEQGENAAPEVAPALPGILPAADHDYDYDYDAHHYRYQRSSAKSRMPPMRRSAFYQPLGAARPSYWDAPVSKPRMESSIYDEDEDAELQAALQQSRREAERAAALGSKQDDVDFVTAAVDEDAQLATAIKRSLEEQYNGMDVLVNDNDERDAGICVAENGLIGATPMNLNVVTGGKCAADIPALPYTDEKRLEVEEGNGSCRMETPVDRSKEAFAQPMLEVVEDDVEVGGSERTRDPTKDRGRAEQRKDGRSNAEQGVKHGIDAGSTSILGHYRLQAVVCHHGRSADCGHFTTDARDAAGGWHRYDDSLVRALDRDRAVAAREERECYMLFYMYTA